MVEIATMRTALNSLEQTLAPECATVLHEAVAEARRRGHAQTTSLHVAAALLTSPGSKLRQACIRSHPGSSAHPLHCRALQLCFNVALDRLPTSAPPAEAAALSNALVAAVKRAQAQQRRACPEQQQQPLLAIKVELDYLILSILDDPSVSRVMSEASFSSISVKSHLLCMALAAHSSASALFRAPSRSLFATQRSEDARRVADVLTRSRRRNPVLVGDMAECRGVVAELAESTVALHGARLVSAELSVSDDVDARLDDLRATIEAACGEQSVIVNLGELTWLAEGGSEQSGRRVVAELGELVVKYGGAASGGRRLWLMGMATCEVYMSCQARHPLMESTWDLQLVPIAASRPGVGALPRFGGQGNICSSFQLHTTSGSFPAITLTSRKPMEGSTTSKMSCCPECMVNYKKELLLIEEKKVILPSTSLSSKPSDQELVFTRWLSSENSIHSSKGSDALQAKDQDITWNHKVEELQNKWNVLCRSLHSYFHGLHQNISGKDSQVSPGLSNNALSRSKISHDNRERQLGICCQPKGEKMNHKISDSQWWLHSKVPSFTEVSTGVQVQHGNFDLKTYSEKQSQIEQSHLSSFSGHLEACSSPVTSVRTDLALGRTRFLPSPPDIKNVLGPKQIMENHKERLKDLTGCMSSDIDLFWKIPGLSIPCSKAGSVNSQIFFPWKSSPESVRDAVPQGLEHRLPNRQNEKYPSDVEAFKRLSEGLKQRVGWQHEVVSSVTDAVVQCISGNRKHRGVCHRGDMWLLFLGPDQFGKRNIACGIAEIIFEGEKSLICLGLNGQEHGTSSNLNFGQQSFLGYGAQFRGKTILDQIADAVKKNPFSVMLLEDIDQADSVVQSSLIQAAERGRLPDSHGREVRIGNIIFVLTAGSGTNNHRHMPKKEKTFPEEKLMEAQGWQMKIIVESARFEVLISKRKRVSVINYDNEKETEELEQVGVHFGSASKRKIDHFEVPDVRLPKYHKASTLSLDLNLAVGCIEAADDSNSFDGQTEACEGFGFDSSYLTVEQTDWDSRYIKELSPLVDNIVTFMPFDLDDLAERVVEIISRKFISIIGSKGLLDIDKNVMQQILATIGFTFDGMKAFEEWAEQVFGSILSELRAAYTISANTIVKLVTVKESFSGGRSPGLSLPKSIFLKTDATREKTGKNA